MKYAVFRCCTTARDLKVYETTTDVVLEKLGCVLHEIKEMGCCGYPLKGYNFRAYVLSAARNLALAERRGLDILTLCNCCYGSLKQAAHLLLQNEKFRDEINSLLARERLRFEGKTQVRHLLDVLHDDIGKEAVGKRLTRRVDGLRVATHYGCHLLRPREVVQFDSPFAPTKFDRLVELTGAVSVSWSTKLDCCGAPLLGTNDELSLGVTRKKTRSARQAGAEQICVACPFCYQQFKWAWQTGSLGNSPEPMVTPILYTQLLGYCLGLNEGDLQLLNPAALSMPPERLGSGIESQPREAWRERHVGL